MTDQATPAPPDPNHPVHPIFSQLDGLTAHRGRRWNPAPTIPLGAAQLIQLARGVGLAATPARLDPDPANRFRKVLTWQLQDGRQIRLGNIPTRDAALRLATLLTDYANANIPLPGP